MIIPEKFRERMEILLKDEYEKFIESYNEPKSQGLRVNTLKISLEDFKRICPFRLQGEIPWEKRGFYINEEKPGKSPLHAAGLYYVQEPSAMGVVPQLKIEEGERVLDLCAAPGGKSTQAAAYLASTGVIVANEIDPKRAKILSENIERLGVKNAVVTNNSPEELKNYFRGYFDKIIVDAPCSGEGMFKKEDAAITEWSQENVEGCAARQQGILESAAMMLREDGYIIYSTCTFSLEENEMVIDKFLKKHDDYELVEIKKRNGFSLGFDFNENKELLKSARLFPHKIRGEGHFMALLHKKSVAQEVKGRIKYNVNKKELKDYFTFCKDSLNITIDKNLYLAGENLYSLPDDLCEIKGLRILRAGINLGTFKKNRFEPNHALALALNNNDVKSSINLDIRDENIYTYLKGGTIHVSGNDGWNLITVNGYSIGWGKMSKGVVKNHYPKGIRW